jgi:peptide/nickel transport system permease protein
MGRDLVSRVLYGMRSSMETGLMGTAIATAIGAAIGLVAYRSNRWIDWVLMAAVEVFLVFPAILVGIGFAGACSRGGCVRGVLHTGMPTVILVIVLSSFPYVARMVRSHLRHGRSLAPALGAYAASLVGASIVLEAGLSFLRAGLHDPTVSLGAIVAGGGANVVAGNGAWWYLIFPGLALLLCVLPFHVLGYGLLRAYRAPSQQMARAEASRGATRYIAGRVAGSALLLLMVSAATFALFDVLPSGGGLHQSFGDYLKGVFLHFDLGKSQRTGHSVVSAIVHGLPPTLSLLAGALCICLLLSVSIGSLWVRARSRVVREVRPATGPPLSATPVFWLGLVGVYLFSTSVGRLAIFDGPGAYRGLTISTSRWFDSLLLPWLVLALGLLGYYVRTWRANLASAMSATYVLTARAKGLRERRVLIRHGLRGAAPPMLPVLGLGLGALFGAAILIETVFNLPGIGRLTYEARVDHDLPVLRGVILLAASLIVIVRLLIDVAYALIDPRARFS